MLAPNIGYRTVTKENLKLRMQIHLGTNTCNPKLGL